MSGKDRTPESIASMAHKHYQAFYTGDGARTEFPIGVTVFRAEDVQVFVNRLLMRPQVVATANDYSVRGISSGYSGDKNMIRLAAAAGAGQHVTILAVGG